LLHVVASVTRNQDDQVIAFTLSPCDKDLSPELQICFSHYNVPQRQAEHNRLAFFSLSFYLLRGQSKRGKISFAIIG
jgi:hypothetical protein